MSPSETSELLCAFPFGKVEQAIDGEKINPIILESNIYFPFVFNSIDVFDLMITTACTPVIHINSFCDQTPIVDVPMIPQLQLFSTCLTKNDT